MSRRPFVGLLLMNKGNTTDCQVGVHAFGSRRLWVRIPPAQVQTPRCSSTVERRKRLWPHTSSVVSLHLTFRGMLPTWGLGFAASVLGLGLSSWLTTGLPLGTWPESSTEILKSTWRMCMSAPSYPGPRLEIRITGGAKRTVAIARVSSGLGVAMGHGMPSWHSIGAASRAADSLWPYITVHTQVSAGCHCLATHSLVGTGSFVTCSVPQCMIGTVTRW